MLENLVIRRIRVEDAEEIGRIYSTIIKSAPKTDFRQIIEEQVRRKEEEASFVAEVDGEVVGYMISFIVYAGFGLDKSAWIATLGVAPRFMGQG
ncbi:MAG: GNAT family N-acetyltransferase, partial [Thermoplasmata archaeon]